MDLCHREIYYLQYLIHACMRILLRVDSEEYCKYVQLFIQCIRCSLYVRGQIQ